MKNFFIIWITVFFSLAANNVQAQGSEVLEMYPDQHVYITGEKIWIAGRTLKGDGSVALVQVMLVDRTGKVIDRIQLLSKDSVFQGNIQLGGELDSDYYMLACLYRGMVTSLTPVMIINPVKPPSGKLVTANAGETNANTVLIPLRTLKNEYQKEEQVAVDLGKWDNGLQYMVTVARRDGLSDYADSVLGGWKGAATIAAAPEESREGHLVKAKVGVPGIRIYATVLGDQANLATAVAGEDGRANVLLPFLHADMPLVLTAQSADGNFHKVNYEPDLPHLNVTSVLPELVIEERFRDDLSQRIISAEISNKFRPADKFAYHTEGLDTTDFYGEPDRRYILDNYTRFPDMQEILQEFIPEIRVRKTNGKPVLQVLNAPFKIFFEQAALVLLDGVPVSDIVQFLTLDPLKLKSVDVITRRFIIGDLQIPGIVHYKSYRADLAGYVLPSDQAVYDFRGIQIPVEPVFTRESEQKDDRLPSMKNLVYWSPFIGRPDAALKFSAPGTAGTYRVYVRGSDGAGTKYQGVMDFTVK